MDVDSRLDSPQGLVAPVADWSKREWSGRRKGPMVHLITYSSILIGAITTDI
jgi:hypothetical protein